MAAVRAPLKPALVGSLNPFTTTAERNWFLCDPARLELLVTTQEEDVRGCRGELSGTGSGSMILAQVTSMFFYLR